MAISPGDLLYFLRSAYRISREESRLVPSREGVRGRSGLPMSVEDLKRELSDTFGSRYPKLVNGFAASLEVVFAEVELGGVRRKIPVSPLSAPISSGSATATVTWKTTGAEGRESLEIRSAGAARVMGAIFLMLGLMAIGGGVHTAVTFLTPTHVHFKNSSNSAFLLFFALQALVGTVVFVGVGSLFAAIGGFFLFSQLGAMTFDSRAETMALRKGGPAQSRPWSDLLGFQLIRSARPGAGQTPGTPRYQLNLLLDDPAKPRFNVCDHGDYLAIESLAARLAELTGKPLYKEV